MTKEQRYRNVRRIADSDTFIGEKSLGEDSWISFEGRLPLMRIAEAMENEAAAARIWAETDAYGEQGLVPPQGFDWSGVRDSSEQAVARMDEIAKEYVTDGDMARLLGVYAVTDGENVRFFDLVEKAWWDEMQGELLLDRDASLGSLALAMYHEAKQNVADTKDALDQLDGKGEKIEGDVPEREYARRVANALAVLFYGGS